MRECGLLRSGCFRRMLCCNARGKPRQAVGSFSEATAGRQNTFDIPDECRAFRFAHRHHVDSGAHPRGFLGCRRAAALGADPRSVRCGQRVVRGLIAAFRSTLNAGSAQRISVYSEHLDLSRFTNPQHDEVLRSYLLNKFRDRPIGVLVAQGSSSLEFVMRARAELWPGVPVVFAAVDAATVARLNLPARRHWNSTSADLPQCGDCGTGAGPEPEANCVTGDPWERQAVRKHYKDEISRIRCSIRDHRPHGTADDRDQKAGGSVAGTIPRSYTRPSTSMAPEWPTFRMKVSPRSLKRPTGRS